MSVKSTDCGTLWLTDSGVFPETDTNMKIVVMPKTAKEILELVENWSVENKKLRAVVNNADIEHLARELGFVVGSEGVVRMTQGIVILVRRSENNFLIKAETINDLLSYFNFSVLVGG